MVLRFCLLVFLGFIRGWVRNKDFFVERGLCVFLFRGERGFWVLRKLFRDFGVWKDIEIGKWVIVEKVKVSYNGKG